MTSSNTLPNGHAIALPICLALCSLQAAQAQVTPPNAGQVLRDLQAPALVTPPSVALPQADSPALPESGNQAKVLVKSIVITGNEEIDTPTLQALVAGVVGTEQTLNQLNAATRRITAYYRSQGFAVARALLPAQDITNGVVTVLIIEGRVSSSRLTNSSGLPDALVASYLGAVKPGDVIRSSAIDRGLLLLQDTPGIAASRATLQPGASVGTSELLVEVSPADRVTGSASLDNYGSRYTGEARLGASLNIANPLQIGDLISLNALTTGAGLSFARVGYQLPVGSDGLKVGAAYFDVRYKLGQEFAALQARGTASSSTVFASYPLIRSQQKNLNATLSYEDKSTSDFVDSTATVTSKKLKITSLGVSGSLQDSWGGGGFNALDVSLIQGRLTIGSPAALALDAVSAQTSGSYSKLTWSASRLQRIINDTFLSMALNGQQAGKNLDSSEKFSLGGPTSIRAYPSSQLSGDEGYRGTVELRQSLAVNVQGVLFYDFGTVKVNKTPFGPAADNNKSLAGAGFGVNASFNPSGMTSTNLNQVQLKASVAWRVGSESSTAGAAVVTKSPTFWLQATLGF